MPKSKAKKEVSFDKMKIDQQVTLIDKIFQMDVYPMLASHGGGLEIMDIDGFVITIKYFGACNGCPISESATLPGIEAILQDKIDERMVVMPAE